MKKFFSLAVRSWNLRKAIRRVAWSVSLIASASVWPWLAYLVLLWAFVGLVKATFEMIRVIIE